MSDKYPNCVSTEYMQFYYADFDNLNDGRIDPLRCDKCDGTTYLLPDDTCNQNCIDGYFKNSNTRECKMCPPPCVTSGCTPEEGCVSCESCGVVPTGGANCLRTACKTCALVPIVDDSGQSTSV